MVFPERRKQDLLGVKSGSQESSYECHLHHSGCSGGKSGNYLASLFSGIPYQQIYPELGPSSHISHFPWLSIQPLWPRWLPWPPTRPCCFHSTLLSISGTTAGVTLLHLSHIGSIFCSNSQWLLSLVALLDCPCRLPPCSAPDSSVPCGCPTHPAPGPLLCDPVPEMSTCLLPTPLRSQRPS